MLCAWSVVTDERATQGSHAGNSFLGGNDITGSCQMAEPRVPYLSKEETLSCETLLICFTRYLPTLLGKIVFLIFGSFKHLEESITIDATFPEFSD